MFYPCSSVLWKRKGQIPVACFYVHYYDVMPLGKKRKGRTRFKYVKVPARLVRNNSPSAYARKLWKGLQFRSCYSLLKKRRATRPYPLFTPNFLLIRLISFLCWRTIDRIPRTDFLWHWITSSLVLPSEPFFSDFKEKIPQALFYYYFISSVE